MVFIGIENYLMSKFYWYSKKTDKTTSNLPANCTDKKYILEVNISVIAGTFFR